MTELKHTPGPWFVDTCSVYAHCQMDEGGMSDEMPILEAGTGRGDDLMGNLALAAAAPDLLEACEIWIQHYDKYVRDKNIGDEIGIAEMRAAIAKAKGES